MSFNKSLNPFVSNIFQTRLTRRDLDRYSTRYEAMQEGALASYDSGYLQNTKVYKGIVLYVEDAGDNSWYFKTLESLNPATTDATKFHRLRVRIPELHAHIPEPCGVGTDEPSRAEIEMHPIFVGRATSTEEPKPGDIVEVSFTKGPQDGIQAGGIYHGIFQSSVGGERQGASTVCGALKGLFEELPRTVGQLADIPLIRDDDRNAHGTRSLTTDEPPEEVIDPATGEPLLPGEQALFVTNEQAIERQQIFVSGPFERPAYVTSEFGQRENPCPTCSSNHLGADFRANEDTPLYALFGGVVLERGTSASIGGYVKIGYYGEDGQLQYSARYIHLNGFASGIEVDAEVRAGQHIAMSGNTGTISTAPHLHLEVQDYTIEPNNGGTYLRDPREYLPPNSIINSRGTRPPPRG